MSRDLLFLFQVITPKLLEEVWYFPYLAYFEVFRLLHLFEAFPYNM